MKKLSLNSQRKSRARRVRARIQGTASRPRLNIFRSLTSMRGQVIDDGTGKTLVSADLASVKGATNSVEGAAKLGAEIAKKAQAEKITDVVFDRAGYKYHGKVKAFADAAREGGLTF